MATKTNPKARNSKKAVEEKKQEESVDLKRMLNTGKEVELSFGTFTVKELDVFTLITIVSDGLETFVSLTSEGSSQLDMIRAIGSDKKLHQQVAKILALFCGEEDLEQFKKIKVKDLGLLITAIKEVIDIEEIKEVFFQLGLQKYLPTTPTSTENETNLEK